MPKLSKTAGIELIIAELKKGTAKDIILSQIVKQCQKNKRTAERYYKEADIKHTEAKNEVISIVKEQTIGAEIEAKKKALNERNERLKILNDKFNELAGMKPRTIKGKDSDGNPIEIKITKGDYLKGIEVMAKLDDRISKAEGTDAPTKTANTDKDGNDVSDPLATLIKSGGGIKIITKH